MRSSRTLAALQVGWETLRVNPLRTILSTLGIVMGVASLVAVLAIGDGVERFVRDQIEETTDLQSIAVVPRLFDEVDGVQLRRSGGYPVFTLADGDGLAAALGDAATVVPQTQGQARLGVPELPKPKMAMVFASAPAALGGRPLAAGRLFTETELRDSARVAVVGAGVAALLAGADTAAAGSAAARALGREVTLEGTPFRVVGVFAARATAEPVARVAVPFTRAGEAMAPPVAPRAPALMVRARRAEQVAAVKRDVERWAAARHGGRWREQVRVDAYSPQRLRQAEQGILVFKLAMGSFAAISLLVGGIGIMNVLLASVLERTREIGIRKAAGARHRDILLQFLSESVAIAGAGAVLGAALGLAGAFGVTALMRHFSAARIHAAFTWPSLLLAAGVSVLVGLAFGTYPALRAARLSPIDAIRHE